MIPERPNCSGEHLEEPKSKATHYLSRPQLEHTSKVAIREGELHKRDPRYEAVGKNKFRQVQLYRLFVAPHTGQLIPLAYVGLNEELAQTENQLHLARLKIGDLQGKLQNMEQNFQNASQRAEIIASQFDEANARISGLHEQIDKLHGQLETLQGKNLDFMKDKLEADAATHVREAAISVLKLRIYALEGDLQKEVFLRTNQLPDSHLKYLTQFSPAIDVEMRAKGSNTVDNLKLREDSSLCYSAPEVGLETSKKQQNESNEVSFKGKKVQSEIHWSENPVLEEHKNDVWNLKELRKLEQGTADVHQKYMNLDKGIKAEKMKPCKSSETDCHRTRFADGSHTQQDTHPSENVKSHGRHQNSCVNVEDECVSRSSNVNQLLWSRSLQHSSLEIAKTSNGLENTCYREWISHRLHQMLNMV